MEKWFTAGWDAVGWVVASTVAMYVITVAAVRVAGRRTVAELSAFDVVVTIALGSIVATTVVSSSPAVAEGAAAVATLLGMQVGVGWLRRRTPFLRRLLDFAPEVVLRDGEEQLRGGPFTAQLTSDELASRLRRQGVFDASDVAVVVLEPTGGLSVVPLADRDAELVRRVTS